MPRMVKNTITDDSTLMEFPSGLSVASNVPDRNWTITVGGIVKTGEIGEDDDLVGMPRAVKELGTLSAQKAAEAGEREDSVEIQYWGRINFDLARFLAFMTGKIPHPDALPYPPDGVSDEDLVAGTLAVVALSLPPSIGEGVIENIASRYGIDMEALLDGLDGDDNGPVDPDTVPGADPDWKPEGWDL